MAETRIFESTNEYSSTGELRHVDPDTPWVGTTDDIDISVGWCAASSAKWCRNRIEGAKPNVDPMQGAGQLTIGVMQAGYRRNYGSEGDSGLLKKTGLKARQIFKSQPVDATKFMVNRRGVYWFRNKGHAMACDTRQAKSYWYDIESGCWKYDTPMEMFGALRKYYKDSQDAWDGWLCEEE